MARVRSIAWRAVAERLAAALPPDRLHPRALARAQQVERSRRPWAVAFSGGADSLAVVLWVWAHWPRRRDRLVLLHFNHRLRGPAASADARFCLAVGESLGVTVDVGAWTAAPRQASEAQARAARNAFFEQAMRRRRAHLLWTGHQQDDVAETLFMRLGRGSGTGGLAAPRPVQGWGGRRVRLRPLITLRKDQIMRLLHEAGARWREDASNDTGVYFRNRLRRRVLPLWEKAAGRDVWAGAALSRERLEEDDDALEQWLDEIQPVSPEGVLRLDRLENRPAALWRRALHRWLLAHPHGSDLSRHGFEDLLSKARAGRTTRFSLGACSFARIKAGQMRFETIQQVATAPADVRTTLR